MVPSEGSPYARGLALLVDSVRPGEEVAGTVVAVNTSDEDVRVALYAADGAPAAGGDFGYTTRDEPTTAVGEWIELSESELTLAPGDRVPVDFRLKVGADAFDGRNVGAIVVEPLDQPVTGAFSTRTRYAMPVTVVVEGGRPRPSPAASPSAEPLEGEQQPLQLRNLEPGERGAQLCPTVVLGNVGTSERSARVTVTTDGPFSGRSSAVTELDVPAAGTTRRVELACVDRPLGPGRVRVSVGDESELDKQVFWVPVSVFLSLLLLLLVICALLTTYLRGKRGRSGRSSSERPSH